MPNKKPVEDHRVQMTVRLHPEVLEKVDAEAARFGTSRTALVELLLEEGLSDLAMLEAFGLHPSRLASVLQFFGVMRRSVDEHSMVDELERIGAA